MERYIGNYGDKEVDDFIQAWRGVIKNTDFLTKLDKKEAKRMFLSLWGSRTKEELKEWILTQFEDAKEE